MPVIENSGVNANRLAQFAQRLPGRGRPIFLTCVFGLGAGLAAVAFQLAMNALYRITYIRLSHQSVGYFLVGSLVVILFSSLAVVGMSACLGAVVRAPVTGILIVFEMTHQFSLVPALMLGALVSQAISRKLNYNSFYEEILVQDGHRLEHVVPPRDLQTWQQLPVSAIANFQPVIVQDCSAGELQKLLRTAP